MKDVFRQLLVGSVFRALNFLSLCLTEPFPTIILILLLIISLPYSKMNFVSSFVTFVKSNSKALLTSIRLSKDAVAPYGVVLGRCPAICELPPNRAVFVKPPCTP